MRQGFFYGNILAKTNPAFIAGLLRGSSTITHNNGGAQ